MECECVRVCMVMRMCVVGVRMCVCACHPHTPPSSLLTNFRVVACVSECLCDCLCVGVYILPKRFFLLFFIQQNFCSHIPTMFVLHELLCLYYLLMYKSQFPLLFIGDNNLAIVLLFVQISKAMLAQQHNQHQWQSKGWFTMQQQQRWKNILIFH